MSDSPHYSIAEFDRFRFVRNGPGKLAELSAARREERVFMVLDCERYRLARLHIFEGLADGDSAAREVNLFTRQMNEIRDLTAPLITPILAHGRDDTELYYVDAFIDGEAMGDYMRRISGLPESAAIQITLDLIDLMSTTSPRPATVENFDFNHLFVTPSIDGGLQLHFSDHSGWKQSPMATPERLVQKLTLGLYSLLGGYNFRSAPSHLFLHESRQTSPEMREMLTAMLEEDSADPRGRSLNSLASALRDLQRLPAHRGDPKIIPTPRRLLQDWLTDGKGTSAIDLGTEYQHWDADEIKSGDTPYTFDASIPRASLHGRVRFQIFPNWESIPHEGWFDQHHTALRRGGGRHGLTNQISVVATEEHGRCLLIGEEHVQGISLETLVQTRGPLTLPDAHALICKIGAAIDSMEKTAGAAPVWWLPPGNVYLVTGDEDPGSLDTAMKAHGEIIWKRLPVRLRLHQTARDLVDGLNVPNSVLKRINLGGKKGAPERRAATLLPLLWHLLTGQSMTWDRPLVCPDSLPLPAELGERLEQFRLQLVTNPRTIQASFVQEIDQLLGNDSASPFADDAEFSDHLVSEPVTVFETTVQEPVPTAAISTFTHRLETEENAASILSGRGNRLGKVTPQSTVALEDTEFLGSIEDPNYQLNPGPPVEDTSEHTGVRPRRRLSLAPFSVRKDYDHTPHESTETESIPTPEFETVTETVTLSEPEPEIASPEEPSIDSAPPEPLLRSLRRRLFFGFGRSIDTTEEAEPEVEETPIENTYLPSIESEIEPEPGPELESESSSSSSDCPDEDEGFRYPSWVRGFFSQGSSDSALSSVALESRPATVTEESESKILEGLATRDQASHHPAPSLESADFDSFSAPENSSPLISPTPAASGEPMSFFSFLKSESVPAEESEAHFVAESEIGLLEDNDASDLSDSADPYGSEKPRSTSISITGILSALGLKRSHDVAQITEATTNTTELESLSEMEELPVPPAEIEPRTIPEETQLPDSLSDDSRAAAATESDSAPEEWNRQERSFGPALKGAAQLAGAAALIWGVTYLLVTFAGSVERQTLAETLAPLVQTDYLKAADPLARAPEASAKVTPPITAENAAVIAKSMANAENPDPATVGALADHYLPIDRPLGHQWLRRSAELGQARHQRQLGLLLARIPESLPEAVSWLQDAADQGDNEAQLYYGAALLRGRGIAPDPAAAFVMIEKAANAGDARALDLLGTCLAEGKGCAPDLKAAVFRFQAAADAGNPPAFYNLGVRYAKGLGTAMDSTRAAETFRSGAELSNADCMHALGRCFESGFGVTQDFDAAVLWMQQAAALGQQDALAWCLRQGMSMEVAGVK